MNQRREIVGYRPLELNPVLQQGILPIERDGGELERRVAAGLARIADTFYEKAAWEAQVAGEQAGRRDAMAGAPTPATITGGEPIGTASVNGQAGHIKGAQANTATRVLWPAHGPADEQAKAILRKEEGFRATPYWDVNAWRIGYGSDTVTMADGTVRRVTQGMKITREDAERDLTHRLTNVEGKKAREQLGAQWDSLPANAQAALASVAYNYGSLPSSVVTAARSGDMAALSSAVAALPVNSKRRQREASLIAGAPAALAILPESRDGPVKVTPVLSPVEITPGQPSTFRPRGDSSIYSRAYDVAGTRTWLQMAKMTIVTEQAELFDKYKDNPAELSAAFDRLLADHKREGVYFDEVAPEYELSFRQNAFELTRQAQSEASRKQAEADQADFLGRVSDLEDRKSQLMAGIDPRDAQSSAMLTDMQATIDSHYDSAVSRGLMKPAQAELAKRESRSQMTVDYYLKQTTGLKPAEVEALQAEMTADYAAGKLTGVTAADWDKISAGMTSIRTQRQAADEKASRDLTARADDIFTRVLRGETLPAADLARLRTDAGVASDGEQILQSTEAKMRLAAALRSQPVGQVEANLDAILKGDAAQARPEDLEFARTKIEEMRKELTVDPIGVAEKFGLVPAAPPIALDGVTDPAALRDALAYRRGAAIVAAKHFGVPVKYFRPGEAAQVAAQAMADPDRMVAFTLNVTSAFGKDTPAAMREISEAGPVMAHAVGTAISTGDASLAREVAQISAMKARKEIDIKMPGADQLAIKGNGYLGAALAQQPQFRNAALSTAALLFEKMAFDQGFDPNDIKTPGSIAEAAYQKALDRALGGQVLSGVETGGLGMVNDRQIIVPALMAKEKPEELIYGLTAGQLEKLPKLGTINGVAVTPRQIRNGYLVSSGDGLYRVALNDPDSDDPAYLISPDGKPWVLDIRALEKIAADPASSSNREVPFGAFGRVPQ